MVIYIIEHLEEKMYRWCLIEYEHISRHVGKKNLWFTNVKSKSKKLRELGSVFCPSVSELKLKNACVLDMAAKQTLKSGDRFDYYIFGGILGDDPPRERTGPELTSKLNAGKRNLGLKQMSTDTAVIVTQRIVQGERLNDIKFIDTAVVSLGAHEESVMPYRYIDAKGKPVISKKLVNYIKRKGF